MKKLGIILVSFFVLMINVKANTLNNLVIDGILDASGNIHITEKWYMKTDKDTEIYKEEYNLGNMAITNFKVSDEKGAYTLNSNWNIKASFDTKKNTYGINHVDEGIELCWGISEYGEKEYKIEYDLSNAIFVTEDADVFYLKLVNDLDFPPKAFSITISGPTEYADSLDVWGYGYKGYAYVSNGKIYASNEENTALNNGDYAVLLIKYPKGTFTTNNSYDKYSTFNDVYEKAEEGSFDYDYNTESLLNKIISKILTYSWFIIFFIISIFAIRGSQKYRFGSLGKKIKKADLNNYRDIPCDKNLFKAFFIATAYSLNSKNTDFIGSIFLKWLNEDKIEVIKEDKEGIFGNKETTTIRIKEVNEFDNECEKHLYEFVKEAALDGYLSDNEFSKWSKDNYDEIFKWLDEAETFGRNYYLNLNLVVKNNYKYYIDDKLKEEAIKLAGLKNYLKEFSSINDKEAIEVKLWKEYLMFAQIFGIADKVANQFKKLYPEVVSEMNQSNLDVTDIILLNHFTGAAMVSAASARSAAESYSSGGGGFSSGGGGGGSFGGGGGGSR